MLVTAEYNHGYTAVLKNALDHTFVERNRKPVAFVGYGNVGGARAIEQLRLVAVELEMAPLRHAVHILPDVMIPARRAEHVRPGGVRLARPAPRHGRGRSGVVDAGARRCARGGSRRLKRTLRRARTGGSPHVSGRARVSATG